MAQGTRHQMIRSAVDLFARRGLSGTSFLDVIEHSGAPRGSIYHHFPGGKEELAAAALDAWSEAASRMLAPLAGRDAAGVVDGFLDGWQAILERSDFAAGCSVLGVTVTTDSEQLRSRAANVFQVWQVQLADLLRSGGLPDNAAQDLAWALIAAAEGAVVLCRAQRSLVPLDAVRRQFKAPAGQSLGRALGRSDRV
jgi:TetR/AcrR family transcriptional repressor of lmrAB and yxaGH operons